MLFLTSLLFSGLTRQTAYLDPGSGSFLLQLLIAAIAGMGIFIGAQWNKVKALFSKKASQQQDENADEEEDEVR